MSTLPDSPAEEIRYFVVTVQTNEHEYRQVANFWTKESAQAFAKTQHGWYDSPAIVGRGVLRVYGVRPANENR